MNPSNPSWERIGGAYAAAAAAAAGAEGGAGEAAIGLPSVLPPPLSLRQYFSGAAAPTPVPVLAPGILALAGCFGFAVDLRGVPAAVATQPGVLAALAQRVAETTGLTRSQVRIVGYDFLSAGRRAASALATPSVSRSPARSPTRSRLASPTPSPTFGAEIASESPSPSASASASASGSVSQSASQSPLATASATAVQSPAGNSVVRRLQGQRADASGERALLVSSATATASGVPPHALTLPVFEEEAVSATDGSTMVVASVGTRLHVRLLVFFALFIFRPRLLRIEVLQDLRR